MKDASVCLVFSDVQATGYRANATYANAPLLALCDTAVKAERSPANVSSPLATNSRSTAMTTTILITKVSKCNSTVKK